MYQVTLRIECVKLNIDQPLLLQLAIRSNNGSCITIPSLYPLLEVEQQCRIDDKYQFLTSTKKLQLCVILFKNYGRKFAGLIQINLSILRINQQHTYSQRPLLHCPDNNAHMSFSISFNKSLQSFCSIDLLSLSDRQMMRVIKQQSQHGYRLKQAKQANIIIEEVHNREFELNKQLYQQLQNLQIQHSALVSRWNQYIDQQQHEITNTVNKLQQQKLLIASVIDIVLTDGNHKLINAVEDILQINSQNNQSLA